MGKETVLYYQEELYMSEEKSKSKSSSSSRPQAAAAAAAAAVQSGDLSSSSSARGGGRGRGRHNSGRGRSGGRGRGRSSGGRGRGGRGGRSSGRHSAAADSEHQTNNSAVESSQQSNKDNIAVVDHAATTNHNDNNQIHHPHPKGGRGGGRGRGRHYSHGRGRGSGGRHSSRGGGRGGRGSGRGGGGRGGRGRGHNKHEKHAAEDGETEEQLQHDESTSVATETSFENTTTDNKEHVSTKEISTCSTAAIIQEEDKDTKDDDDTTAQLLGGLLLGQSLQNTGIPSTSYKEADEVVAAELATTASTTTAVDTALMIQQQPPLQQQQQPAPVLSLPTPPPHTTRGKGKFMILARPTGAAAAAPPQTDTAAPTQPRSAVDYEKEAQRLSERLAAAALEDEDADHHHHQQQQPPSSDVALTGTEETAAAPTTEGQAATAPSEKKKKPKKKKKKSKKKEKENADAAAAAAAAAVPPEEEVSTTDALHALPAQEVSICALSTVKIRRNESSASLSNKGGGDQESSLLLLSGGGGAAPPTKVAPESKKSRKKKKGQALSSDSHANQRAAQRFNNEVRQCVERSDPDAMYALLHDKRHHNFALNAIVLETVMKAYVMAAMFEDALYCLRNCTLPGTLSTLQTERILTCLPQNLRNSSAYTAADMINALCIATEFDSPTARTYFLRIVRGIALEFLEEATSARDRICSSPCERLVRSGLCVVDAHFRRGKKASDLVVLPGEQLGVFVPDTMENRGIQAGDAVSVLPYAGPYPMSAESLDRNMIEATVTNTNPMVLRLQDKTNANLHSMLTEPIDGNVYRIDKLANRMGFNRQLTAAVAIASPLPDTKTRDTRRPCPELIQAITAMDENIDRVMKQQEEAKAMAEGGKFELTSTAALCSQAIPWNADEDSQDEDAIRAASRLALEKYNAFEGLNASQRLAVEGATSNRLTLVQGPPGTGKTLVAIRILQHWARLANVAATERGGDAENPTPILATSDSNIAVDNLVEGCAAVGLRVVRLGRPEAIRPELLRYCIDRPPSSYGNNNNTSGDRGFGGGGGAPNFKERMKQLKTAQVICCTCIGSGGDILDAMTFDRVLVDEATQATEPAVLVPLMRGCRQLVLVGDHCQLPPTVLSTRAEEEGHGVPLFSRMVACGVPPHLLDTQYRMHPRIAMFPSDLFYGGLLRNGVTPPERRPLAGFPWPAEEFPVAFIPVKGTEMDDGVSKYNEAEASIACETVAMLMAGGQCAVSDIAVVTPYAAQAKMIRRMTRRLQQNSGPPYIEVSSVDGFQGREKEAVVFSAVRSNDYGAIGFTSDWRRVNVSFTRARRALIVIGNDATLRRGDPDTWGPWLAWADAHGLNTDKPGIPRGRYEAEQLRRVRGGTTAAEMLKDVLERQQAQLKSAEQQQERAVKNAKGHIRADAPGDGDEDGEGGAAGAPGDGGDKGLSLEEDLAQMENAEGNWDDSDDDADVGNLRHSASKTTLTSATSSNDLRSSDEATPMDVWDL